MRFWPARLKPPYRKEGSEYGYFCAQLAKELEPGLNALFGMEYGRYEGQHAEIFDTEGSTEHSKKRSCCLVSVPHPLKTKALESRSMTQTRRIRGTHETVIMGFSITEEAVEDNSTTVWHPATPVPRPFDGTQSKLRPLPS